VAFDAQSAWMELGAYVALKPNHGRQELLAEMARIAAKHTIPEEEFQIALRLTLPALAELLFTRTARTEAPQVPAADVPDEESDWPRHTESAVRPTMAA
jgi:hypothetical protein